MKIYILLIIAFISCNSQHDIEVVEIKNEVPIIVLPSRSSLDSIETFIPYTFEVKNGSMSSINKVNFKYKSNLQKHSEWDYLVMEGDSVKNMHSKGNDVGGMSSRTFTIYLKVNDKKSNIDGKILNNDLFVTENRLRLLNEKFNRIGSGSQYYKKIRDKIENDSIAITAHYKDYMIIKVGTIGENKFKTITSDDILKNPAKAKESTFKP